MKYLCLAYYDPKQYAKLTPAELAAFEAECRRHGDAFRSAGKILVQASLSDPESTAVVRRGASVEAGPYQDTEELPGGFFIIEARDLNDAVRIASKHPGAIVAAKHLKGVIEVRACGFYEA